MSAERADPDVSILIVEDENIVALDMRYRLEEFGYSVCAIVSTGEAAIAEAAAKSPDLVLMDIMLKGDMDGIEAARQLRAESGTPIVFVTAFTDDATLERVKGAGAYGYIVKPYHERELRIVIELALSKYKYENELRAAKELAEASDKAKTRFLSNISHELKTPLNVIMGFIDLAFGVAADDELKEYVTFAARGARKLETIIDSILDYTKLEFGELMPLTSEFDIDTFLLKCWDPFVFDAYSKGLAVRLYVDPDLPATIRSDEGKLCTLVRNLIDNSVKFTDSGFVLLSAELARSQDGKPELAIEVSDTGPGIPDDKRQSIFSLFTQGDDSPTRAFGGTGIGLSLSKALAKLLDARLEFSSKPNAGSAFVLRFALPADVSPAYPRDPTRAERTVGLYGSIPSMPELRRWAPRLGVRFVELNDNPNAVCDAVVADAESWLKPERAQRHAALSRGDLRVVLLDGPSSRNWVSDSPSLSSLPYPPSLGTLSRALERALSPVGDERAEAAREPLRGQGRKPWASDGGSSAGTASRDYARLLNDARMEANALNLGSDLYRMIEYVNAETKNASEYSVERTVKRYHDRFADAGAVACAKLALAVSMDGRNGFKRPILEALAAMIERRD